MTIGFERGVPRDVCRGSGKDGSGHPSPEGEGVAIVRSDSAYGLSSHAERHGEAGASCLGVAWTLDNDSRGLRHIRRHPFPLKPSIVQAAVPRRTVEAHQPGRPDSSPERARKGAIRGSEKGPFGLEAGNMPTTWGLSAAKKRLTGALLSPMCTPHRPQGRLGEGPEPSQIACGGVIEPPKSSTELPLHISRKQMPSKREKRAIPRKLHVLVALPAASGTPSGLKLGPSGPEGGALQARKGALQGRKTPFVPCSLLKRVCLSFGRRGRLHHAGLQRRVQLVDAGAVPKKGVGGCGASLYNQIFQS